MVFVMEINPEQMGMMEGVIASRLVGLSVRKKTLLEHTLFKQDSALELSLLEKDTKRWENLADQLKKALPPWLRSS